METSSLLNANTRLFILAMVLGCHTPASAQLYAPSANSGITYKADSAYSPAQARKIQRDFLTYANIDTSAQEIKQALKGAENYVEKRTLLSSMDSFTTSYRQSIDLLNRLKHLNKDINGHTLSPWDKQTLVAELKNLQLSVLKEKEEIPASLYSVSTAKERLILFLKGQDLSPERAAYFKLHTKIYQARHRTADSLQDEIYKLYHYTTRTPALNQGRERQ